MVPILKLAVHAGNAPAQPIRQTGRLLLHQWTYEKLVAEAGIEPAGKGL